MKVVTITKYNLRKAQKKIRTSLTGEVTRCEWGISATGSVKFIQKIKWSLSSSCSH